MARWPRCRPSSIDGTASDEAGPRGAVTETLWRDTVSVADATSVATTLTDALIERLLVAPPDLESRVYEAMRYSALAPGKRMRPLLVLAGARVFRVARMRALQVAAAGDIVHAHVLSPPRPPGRE